MNTNKSAGMTLAEHQDWGKAIDDFYRALLLVWNTSDYGKTSKEAASLDKTMKALDELKHQFDSAVCREHPERKDVVRIYYGPRE